MDSGVIKELFVALGFKVDSSSQARFEQATKAAEEKVTAVNIAEAAKRLRSAEQEAAGRVAEAVAAGAEITEAEKKLLLAQDKLRQEADKKEEDRRKEAQKRAEDRHKKALAAVQAFGMQVVAVATKVTLAVEGIALGVVRVTDKAAQAFERLNYSSQRIGASAQGMNAFAYASAQLGSSVGVANQSLKAFGDRIATFPGMAGALEKMGVQVRDAKGHMLEAEQIAANFGEHLRKVQAADPRYGRANALNLAEANGIDRDQAMTMMDPRFSGLMGEYKRTQAKIGDNDNDAAQSGTAFEQSMRRLEQVITDISTKVETSLFKKLQPQLDDLAKWATENGSRIANDLTTIAEKFVAWAAAIGTWLASVDWKAVFDHLDRLFKGFDDIARKLTGQDGLTAAFEALAAVLTLKLLGPLSRVLTLLTSLTRLGLPPWLAGLLGLPAAVALGASAESTPGAGVSADPAARAAEAQHNREATEAANKRQGYSGNLLKDTWTWIKRKTGLEPAPSDAPGQGASSGILDMIRKGEVGTTGPEGYDVITHQYHGQAPSTPISKMTVDQVLAFQEQMLTAGVTDSAVGGYQINHTTLQDFKRQMGLKGSETFDADLQTRMAQRIFASTGGDPGRLRGRWLSLNKQSDDAIRAAIGAGGASSGSDVGGQSRNVNPVLLAMIRRAQELTGEKLSITSGFRTPLQNRLTGGAENSLHMRGYAADLHSDAHSKSDRAFWENIVNPAMAKAADELGQPYRWGGRFGGRYLNDNNHFDLTSGGPTADALRKVSEAGKTVARAALDRVGAQVAHGAAASLFGFHPDGGREGTDRGYVSPQADAYRKTLSPAMQKLYDAMGGAAAAQKFQPHLEIPKLAHPAGHPSATSINNSRTRGDTVLNNAPTYNIHGSNVSQSMEMARMSATRGAQDLIRNMQSAET